MGLCEGGAPRPLARPVESHPAPRVSPSGAPPAASTMVSRTCGGGGLCVWLVVGRGNSGVALPWMCILQEWRLFHGLS